MTKGLANKIRLKERLYTFRMAEGTHVQKHLNEFNSILVDLESLYVRLRMKIKLFYSLSLPLLINTLKRLYYIVILILYFLRMSSLICYLRRNLTMISMLIRLRD